MKQLETGGMVSGAGYLLIYRVAGLFPGDVLFVHSRVRVMVMSAIPAACCPQVQV